MDLTKTDQRGTKFTSTRTLRIQLACIGRPRNVKQPELSKVDAWDRVRIDVQRLSTAPQSRTLLNHFPFFYTKVFLTLSRVPPSDALIRPLLCPRQESVVKVSNVNAAEVALSRVLLLQVALRKDYRLGSAR